MSLTTSCEHIGQEDTLASAAANSQVDGFDASEIAADPTTIRTNYTQIMAKAIKVATTTDKVSTYGRAKETALSYGSAV